MNTEHPMNTIGYRQQRAMSHPLMDAENPDALNQLRAFSPGPGGLVRVSVLAVDN